MFSISQEERGECVQGILYFLLSFPVNLKLLKEKVCITNAHKLQFFLIHLHCKYSPLQKAVLAFLREE